MDNAKRGNRSSRVFSSHAADDRTHDRTLQRQHGRRAGCGPNESYSAERPGRQEFILVPLIEKRSSLVVTCDDVEMVVTHVL
jgi:hypothetical protein